MMKTLTEDYAIKNKFSGIDCVKYFNPDWTDEDCDFYLWEFTCFPFSTTQMINHLNKEFSNNPKTQ